MKFKLDENFGTRTLGLFEERSHDAETVVQEDLGGSSDQIIYEICKREHRCLVTLDLDFADVTRFPPHQCAGIAVIRLPKNPTLNLLSQLVTNLLNTLSSEPIEGRLWIVEANRIRIHEETVDEN